jgi:hypothetical protein
MITKVHYRKGTFYTRLAEGTRRCLGGNKKLTPARPHLAQSHAGGNEQEKLIQKIENYSLIRPLKEFGFFFLQLNFSSRIF